MFLIHYKPHNALHIDAKFYGPFPCWDDAYWYLAELPAIGIHEPGEDGITGDAGFKYIAEMTAPEGI